MATTEQRYLHAFLDLVVAHDLFVGLVWYVCTRDCKIIKNTKVTIFLDYFKDPHGLVFIEGEVSHFIKIMVNADPEFKILNKPR